MSEAVHENKGSTTRDNASAECTLYSVHCVVPTSRSIARISCSRFSMLPCTAFASLSLLYRLLIRTLTVTHPLSLPRFSRSPDSRSLVSLMFPSLCLLRLLPPSPAPIVRLQPPSTHRLPVAAKCACLSLFPSHTAPSLTRSFTLALDSPDSLPLHNRLSPTASQSHTRHHHRIMAAAAAADAGEAVVAIALGETSVRVALLRNQRIDVLFTSSGARQTPACVAFTDSRCLVGQEAREQVTANPGNTILGPRKLLGLSLQQLQTLQLPYTVVGQEASPLIQVKYKRQDHKFSPEGLVAMLLTKARDIADSSLGSRRATRAILSVASDERQRLEQPLKTAAALAGFQGIHLMDEAHAVVQAFGITDATVVVVHVGGETASAAVVSVNRNGECVTKSRRTARGVAGAEIDRRLLSHCQQVFQRETGHDISGNIRATTRLIKPVHEAKVRLSNAPDAVVEVEFLHQGSDLCVTICRSELEQMAHGLFFNVRIMIDDAVADAGLQLKDVRFVIPVGGSCRIPRLKEMMRDMFPGRCGVVLESEDLPPELVLLHGLAMQTAFLDEAHVIPTNEAAAASAGAGAPPPVVAAAAAVVPPPPVASASSSASPASIPSPPKQPRRLVLQSKPPPAVKVQPQRLQGRAAAAAAAAPPVAGPSVARREEERRRLPPGPVIGVDLGTTYSCVGAYRDGAVEIFENELGRKTTPSVVAVLADGSRLVGDAARDHAALEPQDVVFEVKRLMGRRFHEEAVQSYLQQRGRVTADARDEVPLLTFKSRANESMRPEQVSAVILQRMRTIAEAATGTRISKAVITVPARFDDRQRQATITAGRLAGLEVLKIINEPTAAAIAFSLDSVERGSARRVVLVYDFGGGTFDVSLLEVTSDGDRELRVLATDGDTHLGGEDLDNLLAAHIRHELMQSTGRDVFTDDRARHRLRNACRLAKEALSEAEEYVIKMDELLPGLDVEESMTRHQLEQICEPIFQRTMPFLASVIQAAGISKDQVHDVVLVGGSTRIPRVQQLVSQFFGGKELKTGAHPDEAVAAGAVTQAGMLSEAGELALADVRVSDVTPLSLGVGVEGDLVDVLIRRNTRIPVQVERSLTTLVDNQDRAFVDVLQGERRLVKDNVRLGSVMIEGIPPARAGGVTVSVVYSINANGVLSVKARPSSSAPYVAIPVDDPGNVSEAQITRMLADSEASQAADRAAVERITARNQLFRLCYDHRQDARLGRVARDSLAWLERNPDADYASLTQRLHLMR